MTTRLVRSVRLAAVAALLLPVTAEAAIHLHLTGGYLRLEEGDFACAFRGRAPSAAGVPVLGAGFGAITETLTFGLSHQRLAIDSTCEGLEAKARSGEWSVYVAVTPFVVARAERGETRLGFGASFSEPLWGSSSLEIDGASAGAIEGSAIMVEAFLRWPLAASGEMDRTDRWGRPYPEAIVFLEPRIGYRISDVKAGGAGLSWSGFQVSVSLGVGLNMGRTR